MWYWTFSYHLEWPSFMVIYEKCQLGGDISLQHTPSGKKGDNCSDHKIWTHSVISIVSVLQGVNFNLIFTILIFHFLFKIRQFRIPFNCEHWWENVIQNICFFLILSLQSPSLSLKSPMVLFHFVSSLTWLQNGLGEIFILAASPFWYFFFANFTALVTLFLILQ